MKLHVDGHTIPIFTESDIPEDEDPAQFDTPVTAHMADGGFSVVLKGSEDKAVMYNVRATHPDDETQVLMDYTLVRPPGGANTMNLASLRPFRVAGRQDPQADALHQVRLFHAVGTVTVAGGHVEMAMKRVLVTLRGGENNDLASTDTPAEWSRLQQELEKEAKSGQTDLHAAVLDLLNGDEPTRLREARNDIIHGYWWLIPMGTMGMVGSRYFHPNSKQDPALTYPKPEHMQKLAGRLFDLAHKLEALVTPHWPLAIVPALPLARGQNVTLVDRPEAQATRSVDIRPPEPAKPKPGQRPQGSSGRGTRKRSRRR